MPFFSPQQLQSTTGGTWAGGRVPTGCISGFTQDSRLLQAGMCFVALQTAARDGHDFVPAALAAGATMALVARETAGCLLPQLVVADPLSAFQQIARAHRLSFAGKVIGVTGSCGKTSTKNILQILLGKRCYATAGNLNNFIGVPLTLLGLETGASTAAKVKKERAANCAASLPSAVATEPAFTPSDIATDVASTADFAVIEAGISEPGEMAVLAAMIRPDIALVTLVGPAHLQDLGSVEGVAAQKAQLAAAQGQGVENTSEQLPLLFAPLECWRYSDFSVLQNKGAAVVSFKNKATESLIRLPSGIALHRYRVELVQSPAPRGQAQASGGAIAGDHGVDVAQTAGTQAALVLEGEQLCGRFSLSFMPSEGMASNLALALLAAHAAGCSPEQLGQRVGNWRPQGNRGSWQRLGERLFFVDCYNANPASMADALHYFTDALEADPAAASARLFVIGGMRELGEQSAQWHRQLGEQLGQLLRPECADRVVLIAAEPDRAACLAGIRAHAPAARVECFSTTAEVRPVVDAFRGAVFLKGSRFYALEALLPEEVDG